MSHSRRRVLRWLGISLAMPMLESTLGGNNARANGAASKKRFIGCFFPSGVADMVNGANGDWTYNGALKVLADRGLKDNVLVTRGFRAQHKYDIHWDATAGFLSCNEVGSWQINAPDIHAGERCGKTLSR